ncbi:prolactin-releasing peptide receptor [Neocloeon triangulifer]|uniref:prolactin-releasing peptide receptor n=1 Tax=Neocloeon triangulifer TaxID=2078957 RepID=UPI00286F7EF7|nr:prolactin-releasing peptide receptor [Neocloeon triangulifer]XP_059486588.1 prolactin-releasing peptide receptor [Neocloeon triangulifer]
MNVQLAKADFDRLGDQNYQLLVEFFKGLRNNTRDFKSPHLRLSMENIYPLFVTLYMMLTVIGTLSNVVMIVFLLRKSVKEPLHGLMVNLAASDVVKCLLVLPASLAVLLIHNWVFGSTFCYLLPMLQDMPLHVTTLTLVMIAVDRHRKILHPMRSRFSSITCCLAIWFGALLVVMPYPIYTTYLDLGLLYKNERFDGVGICAVNLAHDMQEYTRGLFIAMYVIPMAIVTFLHINVSRELKTQLAANLMNSPPIRDVTLPSNGHGCVGYQCRECSVPAAAAAAVEIDVMTEQRTQKYVVMMTAVFAICLCPLAVLRMIQLILMETYDNTALFDFTFVVVVWIAFLPTCLSPLIYALWSSGNRNFA